MIEVWLVDLDAAAPALHAIEAATPRLSTDDRRRIALIKDVHEQVRRTAAYIALRVALERVVGTSVRSTRFVRDAGGKPSLAGNPVAFSLSHADEVALIAVASDGVVGVDIEKQRLVRVAARRRADLMAVARGLARAALPEDGSDDAFLRAWVRLEAYAKAQGKGLARLLADIGVRGAAGNATTVADIAARARRLACTSKINVHALRLPQGLFGAVASGPGTAQHKLRIFPVAEPAIRRLTAARRRA